MKKIKMLAKLDKDANIVVSYNEELNFRTKHMLQNLLNKTINQRVYNDMLIINDFKLKNKYTREYTFTLQYKEDLEKALIYSDFTLYYDIEEILKNYSKLQKDINNIEIPEVDINPNPEPGEFGLVFSEEEVKKFQEAFARDLIRRKEYDLQKDFCNKYDLSDEAFDYIKTLAA